MVPTPIYHRKGKDMIRFYRSLHQLKFENIIVLKPNNNCSIKLNQSQSMKSLDKILSRKVCGNRLFDRDRLFLKWDLKNHTYM